mmetsp:Transcript_22526/g.38896  ORF Transcript_22526/g.38896 Transcript_22526/m.38896 type:complete len:385 (+) Transcript_22526:105-1259(+)|eukprot:CAMPEP_0184691188 /NCGR_PEP_ID=MMETSP0313-20130426/98_1 /TAXON_ID=2792 /ORGANISM="Porphyridium aerugineum, Strain SAG 1380-2" /LENGTH=384 /DNA_ID=CAMNT_0027148857 /DNA_START=78 /DNA_END=1232 /DNA_ORIENTATION=+
MASSGGSLSSVSNVVASSIHWVSVAVQGRAPVDRHEALALLVHGVLLFQGFRPTGQELVDYEREVKTYENARLPSQWGNGGYGGQYLHLRSSLTFEIRSIPMGSKLIVHGTFLEDDREISSLELKVDRYVSGGRTYSDLCDVLMGKDPSPEPRHLTWTKIFENREELASLIQINIVQKLVPESTKEGYEESKRQGQENQNRGSSNSSGGGRPSSGGNGTDRRPPPPEPMSVFPDFHPLYPRNPLNVGDDDLLPAGFPTGPGFVPDLRMPGQGGNLMGPGHPGFRSGGGIGDMPRAGSGTIRLPPGVPPGARFDPYGPPGMGFGFGEPDNDIEMPPGFRPPPPSSQPNAPPFGTPPRRPQLDRGNPGGRPSGGPPSDPPFPDMYW